MAIDKELDMSTLPHGSREKDRPIIRRVTDGPIFVSHASGPVFNNGITFDGLLTDPVLAAAIVRHFLNKRPKMARTLEFDQWTISKMQATIDKMMADLDAIVDEAVNPSPDKPSDRNEPDPETLEIMAKALHKEIGSYDKMLPEWVKVKDPEVYIDGADKHGAPIIRYGRNYYRRLGDSVYSELQHAGKLR